MLLFQKGRDEALGILARRYEARLYNYLLRMVGNRAEAEDLFQDAFLRVVRHKKRYKQGKPFKPWLYRIASNLCKDHYKYRSYRRHRSLDAQMPGQGPALSERLSSPDSGPDSDAWAGEIAERLEAALEKLPPKHRAVFLMARYEQLSYPEIAMALRIPAGTVKSRMNKAVRILQEELKDLMS